MSTTAEGLARKVEGLPNLQQLDVMLAVISWARRHGSAPELDKAEEVLGDPLLWPKGHELFRETRQELLRSKPATGTRESILLLVENVAKAAANASGWRYDRDVGYWAILTAMHLGESLGRDAVRDLSATLEGAIARVEPP